MVRLEIFNEFFIAAVTFNMFYFTDWVASKDAQYMYGWMMVGYIVLILMANLLVVFYFAFLKIKLLLTKFYNRIKR
jgi:FtsH-binding integral membrane protein